MTKIPYIDEPDEDEEDEGENKLTDGEDEPIAEGLEDDEIENEEEILGGDSVTDIFEEKDSIDNLSGGGHERVHIETSGYKISLSSNRLRVDDLIFLSLETIKEIKGLKSEFADSQNYFG